MSDGAVRGRTVLVVDSDNGTRFYLRQGLSAEGYVVNELSSPEIVPYLAAHKKTGIVLLGTEMGLQTRWDLVRSIRKISSATLIVLSAHNDEKSLIDAIKNGADDYVCKPFYLGEMLARIKTSLRRTKSQRGRKSALGR